jgi:uncharacterized protein YjcR
MNPKQNLAQELFLKTDQTRQEIADAVGISIRTLHSWIDKYAWEDMKAAKAASVHNIQNISFRIAEKFMKQMEEKLSAGAKLDNGDIDSINKLSRALKNISGDESLSMYISVFSKFLSWLKDRDLETAKQVSPFMQEFQLIKAEELSQ